MSFANLPKFSCMYLCHVPQGRILFSFHLGGLKARIYLLLQPRYTEITCKKFAKCTTATKLLQISNSFLKISFTSLWNFSNQSVWHSNFNKSPTPAEVDDFFLVIVWGSIYNKIVEETHKRTTLIDCCEGCHTAIYWSRL